MDGVRPIESKDLPTLTDIHLATFGDYGPTRDQIDHGYQVKLPELILEHPDAHRASPSLVFELDGEVVGFVLVMARSVRFRGEQRWSATSSHLGVLPAARSSLASIHLLRAVAAGPQDLTYDDRSNSAGRKALKAAGFEQFPAYSFRWEKVLRPGVGLSRRADQVLPRGGRAVTRFAELIEARAPEPIRKRAVAELPPLPKGLSSEPLMLDAVIETAPSLLADVELHPDFTDRERLERLWAMLGAVRANSTIVSRAVTTRNGKTIGWYIVDLRDGGDADVVQFRASPAQQAVVMLSMLHELREREAVRAHGELPMGLVFDAELLGCRPTLDQSITSVKSSDPEIIDAFQRGTAWLSPLDGEFLMDPIEAVVQ